MKLTRLNSPVSDIPARVAPIAARNGIATACVLALLGLAACGGSDGGSSAPAQGNGATASGDAATSTNSAASTMVTSASVDSSTASDDTPVTTDAGAAVRGGAQASTPVGAPASATSAQATDVESVPATKPTTAASTTVGVVTPGAVTSTPAPAPAGATVGTSPATVTVATAPAPVSAPAPAAPQTDAVLALLNLKRSATQKCGATYYSPARPLVANLPAEQAATQHSTWMQQNLSLSHTGAGGSDPGSRLVAAGFDWSAVAENVAAGYDSSAQVIEAWMESAPHCANIMRGDFTAVGYSMVPKNGATVAYATLVLAKGK